ncbi:hypothetical protein [Aquihabitans sp. McL0605]|uniref:hypothetical protein n=1 Tax=Aquihabitans sp. McL0605 TaxID=3415671 RepID=UPI003CF5A9D6
MVDVRHEGDVAERGKRHERTCLQLGAGAEAQETTGSGPVVGFLLSIVGQRHAPTGVVVTRIGAALRAGTLICAINQIVE